MPDSQDQSKFRWIFGGVITAIVWALYLVRVAFGVGPMHNDKGNQESALHYLAGALIVTGMVVVWIAVRAFMERRKK